VDDPRLPTARRDRGVERAVGWTLGVGLAALLLFQFPSLFWQPTPVPKLVVLRLLTAVLLVLLGVDGLLSGRDRRRVPWYLFAACLFLAWAFVAALAGDNPRASIFGAVYRYEGWLAFASYFVVFLAARRVARTSFLPHWWAVMVGGVVITLVGLLGLLQQVWPASSRLLALSLMSADRSFATFGNPIMLGLFAGLCLPVLIALLSLEWGWLQPVLVTAFGVMLATAYFTYARAFWLAGPLGILLTLGLLLLQRRLRWQPVVIGALVGALLIAAVSVARPSSESRAPSATLQGRVIETLQGGGTVRSRFELYRGALTLISERPFLGRGFETYTPQGARVRTEYVVRIESPFAYPDRPHDSLLYVGYATGVIGLALYILFVAGAGIAAVRGYRIRGGPDRVFAAGLLGGLLAYFLGELSIFSTIEVSPLFWALLGWSTVLPALLRPDSPEGATVGRSVVRPREFALPRWVAHAVPYTAIVCGVAWSVLAVPHALAVARADHAHHLVSTQLQSPGDHERLVAVELRAASRDPSVPYYWNSAAVILERAAEDFQEPRLLDRAREALTEGLTHMPNDPTLIVTLSNVELQANHPQAAVDLLLPYLAVDRFQTDAHFNVALAYMTLGQPAKAVEHLETVVDYQPQDAEAYAKLADAYEAAGRAADAAKAWSRAAELDPSTYGKSG